MENKPWNDDYPSYEGFPPAVPFETGKRELIFGLLTLLSAMALCNFGIYGGLNLGFVLAALACGGCCFFYLIAAGKRPSAYSCGLMLLSLVILLGFARSNDSFVKGVMVCFLFVSIQLALCLTAGQNRFSPGSVGSLTEPFRVLFSLSLGRLSQSISGLKDAFRRSGNAGQKGGAFLVGILICVPVLGVMIPLLVSADAAFDGLMALLPDFDGKELFVTLALGTFLGMVLYSRGVALQHSEKPEAAARKGKGIHPITVNTVLTGVCVLYGVYLLSQLAYLSGGLSGILPEGFTLAEYARRGFFEMAALCGINLTVMVLSLGLVRKETAAPVATKLLCLFLGLVSLFLVTTASAKMFLYIDGYGLTRLRVLTQIIMLFMALCTLVICVWLFVPRLQYMKAILLIALALGAGTLWMDVNTVVATYNVSAYLDGRLEHPDTNYLVQLDEAAIPQLARLSREAPDDVVRREADRLLGVIQADMAEDFRGWNYVNQIAASYLSQKDA